LSVNVVPLEPEVTAQRFVAVCDRPVQATVIFVEEVVMEPVQLGVWVANVSVPVEMRPQFVFVVVNPPMVWPTLHCLVPMGVEDLSVKDHVLTFWALTTPALHVMLLVQLLNVSAE
jgi:hypothetical protein